MVRAPFFLQERKQDPRRFFLDRFQGLRSRLSWDAVSAVATLLVWALFSQPLVSLVSTDRKRNIQVAGTL